MKKKILGVLALFTLLLVCVVGLFACNGGEKGSVDTRNQQIVSVYNTYVAYAEESGITPLSYEEWLESIKGKDGLNGKDGKDGEDGLGAYELYKKYHTEYNKTEEEFLDDLVNNRLGEDENPQGLDFYLLPNGTYAVGAGQSKYLEKIIIPETYKGKPVTEIVEFNGSKNLKELVIPNSVITIGSSAFEYCSSLQSVYYTGTIDSWVQISFGDPNRNPLSNGAKLYINNELVTNANIKTATKINAVAFYGCDFLTTVTISNSVTTIGDWAFAYCSSLTSVTIGNSVTTISNFAFLNCSSLQSVYYTGTIDDWVQISFDGYYANPLYNGAKLYINNELVTNANIKKATKINDYAFNNCSSLTSVTIGDSVTAIGYDAFYDCSSLTSIEIPNSVTTIGSYAFYKCSSLTSIEIPNSVTTIEEGAFSNCPIENASIPTTAISSIRTGSLKTVIITGGDSIGNRAFYGCRSLTNVTIPDSVTTIGDSAFYDCDSLTTVTIPDSVITIGESAFESCSSLTSVTIGNSVTTIGSLAFSGCSKLQYNEYDNGLYLGNGDNKYLVLVETKDKSITSYIINDNCKIIYGAFYSCFSLTSVTIGNSVTTISNFAFKYCYSLQSVYYTGTIDDWVQISFGSSDANPLSNGAKLYINNELVTNANIQTATKINEYAFYHCSSLTSVTIGGSVTTIGEEAFRQCYSLTSVTIGNSVTTIGYRAFSDCYSLTTVTIPDSVTIIGSYAFYNCSSLQSITFSDSSNWYRTKSYDDWQEKMYGILTNLSNPTQNVTYFKLSYSDYYWYKK